MLTPNSFRFIAAALFAPLSAASTFAASTRPTDQRLDTAVVTLNPFEVSSEDQGGYLPSEATSGTRYSTPIMETPFAVNVITKDFMQDFLAIDLTGQDMLSYTSSFAFAEGTGAFNLRGIRSFSVYKNGIREGGVLGPASLERTEVIKGPNAAIYGQSEPSGMINRITKKGQERPFQELRVTFGEDETSRVQLDVNQPIVPGKVLARFAASQEYSRFGMQDFARFRRTNAYGSVTWKIAPGTTLTTNAEYIWFRSNTQSATTMPFVFTPTTINGVVSNQFVGLFGREGYENFSHVNTSGPFAYNQVEYTQIDSTLSQRITDWLTVRALGSYWNRGQNQFGNTNAGTNANAYNTATGMIQGTSSPNITRNRSSQTNGQVDILADFKIGAVGQKILLTGDYLINDAYSSQKRTSLPAYVLPLNNFITGGPYFLDNFPYNYDYRNPAWNVSASNTINQTVTKGLMLSDRSAFFNNRLFLLVGGRYDVLDRSQIDFLNPIQAATQRVDAGKMIDYPTARATTYQTGSLFRVNPHVSVYANYSSSFLPQGTGLTIVDISGNPLDPQKGNGGETGVKLDLMEGRLSLTSGVYSLLRTNLPRTARDPAGNPILIPGPTAGTTRQYSTVADVRSKGVEFDANWRPTNQISVTLGLGYNDIKYVGVPNATEQYLLGIPPDSSPAWTGGSTFSYRFATGFLKGFVVRATARYQGSSLVNNSTASIFGDSGVKGAPVTIGGQTYNTYFFENSDFWLFGGGASYRWKQGRIEHSINLDVTNLSDTRYLRSARVGDPRSVSLGYTLKL